MIKEDEIDPYKPFKKFEYSTPNQSALKAAWSDSKIYEGVGKLVTKDPEPEIAWEDVVDLNRRLFRIFERGTKDDPELASWVHVFGRDRVTEIFRQWKESKFTVDKPNPDAKNYE